MSKLRRFYCDMYLTSTWFYLIIITLTLAIQVGCLNATTKQVEAKRLTSQSHPKRTIYAKERYRQKRRELKDSNYSEIVSTNDRDNSDPELSESFLSFTGANPPSKRLQQDEPNPHIQTSSSAETDLNDKDVERLVRDQVDFAASKWASIDPLSSSQISNSIERFAVLDPNSTIQNLDAIEVDESSRRGFETLGSKHTNHNYEIDGDFSGSTSESDPMSVDRNEMSGLKTTADPMTTSSSERGKGFSWSEKLSRGKLQNAPKSSNLRQSNSLEAKGHHSLEKIGSTLLIRRKSSSTVSPKLVKAFEMIDNMKNRGRPSRQPDRSNNYEAEPSNTHTVIQNLLPETQIEQTKLFERTGNINEKGFMDVPASSGVQELAEQQRATEMDRNQHEVSTGRRPSQASPKPTDPNVNLNGDLAARLNANRFKNRLLDPPRPRQGFSSTTKLEPLTVNVNRHKESSFKLQDAEPTTNSFTYATTLSPQTTRAQLDTAAQHNRPPVKATTSDYQTRAPALRTSTTIGAPSTTTQGTISPSLVSAILAAALNNTKTNQNPLAISNNLAHHHLHSHVHSIKPAVITLPLQNNQPKLNQYETIIAAAAAAAAAANVGRNRGSGDQNLVSALASKSRPAKLGALTRAQSMISSQTIPIGGTLALLQRQQASRPAQDQQQTILVPSIISNLIDSANRAIKQVAESKSSFAHRPRSLQVSHSNQVTSTHHDPNHPPKGFQTQIPSLLGLQRGGQHDSISAGELQQQEPFGNPIDSVGLFQYHNDDNSPLAAYLANLLASNALPNDQGKPSTEAFLSAMEGEGPESSFGLPLASPGTSDWDSNSSTIDPDGMIFAPLGGNPNILYPMFRSQGNQLDSPQFAGIFDQGQVINSSLQSTQLFQNALDNPRWFDQIGSNVAVQQPKSLKSPAPPLTKNNKSMFNNSKKGNKLARPMGLDGNHPTMQHFMDQSDPIPFALSHYMDEDNIRQPFQNNPQSLIDVFDDSRGPKLSIPPPIQFLPTDGIDSFSVLNSLRNSSSLVPKLIPGSNTKNNPLINDAIKQQQVLKLENSGSKKFKGFGSARNPAGNSGQSMASATTGGYIQSPHSRPTATNQQMLHIVPEIQVYPGDILHQALVHAGSSLKPHLMLANDLLHQQRQQLIEHHFSQHHIPDSLRAGAQDMATSESARLAAVASVPSKWAVMAHYWPLALALLPVMIVVAIVAQLVMTAPLMMFALTTLTVSRFAATVLSPLGGRDSDGRGTPRSMNDSALGASILPSQNMLTSDHKSNSTSEATNTRRRGKHLWKTNDSKSNYESSIIGAYLDRLMAQFEDYNL